MILIDSHCHLDMLAEDFSLNEILSRAKQNHVEYMQTICTKLDNFQTIIKIAEKFDNIFASVGVHPNEVTEEINYRNLCELSSHPKVIGLGETGLDYYYQSATRFLQKKCFVKHILVAQHMNIPVIVHTRDAEEDTADIIKIEMNNAHFSGLIHCFTASLDFAKKMLDVGMYISIAGIVTFKNAESLRDVVRYVPLDRLLIETDSPYLAPVPMRGKQNEPAFVKYVANSIAEIKNTTLEMVANQTTENFFNLFSKSKKFISS